MVRWIADLGPLVGDLQQTGPQRSRCESLYDLDGSAARRSGQLRGEQGTGDGVPEAHLALHDLQQVIERAGIGCKLVPVGCQSDEADAVLSESVVDRSEV